MTLDMHEQPKPVAGLPASTPAVGGILILHQHLKGLIYCPYAQLARKLQTGILKGAPLSAMRLGEAVLASPSHLANL